MYNQNKIVLGMECYPMYFWDQWVAEINSVWHSFEEVRCADGKLVLQFIELCPDARAYLADLHPVFYGVRRCACFSEDAIEFVQLYYNPQLAFEKMPVAAK